MVRPGYGAGSVSASVKEDILHTGPWFLIALVFALVSLPINAFARAWVVAPDGDDANPGTRAAPLKSIDKAAAQARPGDTIFLRKGTYPGGITLRRPGRADAWIALRPYGKERVVIDGRGKEIALYFYRDDQAPMYWRVEGLEIQGGNAYVVKIDTPRVSLLSNKLHGSKADIVKLVKGADDVLIEGNEIHHPEAPEGANAQGIDIVGADRTVVRRNHVHHIPSIAMFAKGNAKDTLFEHNLIEHVHFRGISVGAATDKNLLAADKPYESYNATVRHNLIRNTGGACLSVASSIGARLYRNRCENVAARFQGAIYVANESEIGQPARDIEIRDNVFVRAPDSRRPMVHIAANALASDDALRLDGNVYWSPGGARQVIFAWERDGSEGKARFPGFWGVPFEQWQRLTGLDKRSRVGNPPRQRDDTRL